MSKPSKENNGEREGVSLPKKQEKKQGIEEKRSRASYLVESLVSFFLLAAFSVAMVFVDLYSRNLDWGSRKGTIFADSFFASGILGLMLWLLFWVSRKGAFDILVYGVGRFIDVVFRLHPENQKMPKTYGEYVERRRAKKHDTWWIALGECLFFALVGLILSLIYLNEGL